MEIKKVRLNKRMAELGLCSRREADEYIQNGMVLVDGQPVHELGHKVSINSKIDLRKVAQKKQDHLITILLNKPVGYVSSQPEKGYTPAIKLLSLENCADENPGTFNPIFLKDLAVVGRLDIDSKGLLVFTQDGRIAKQLISDQSDVEKEYIIKFQGDMSDAQIKLLRFGLELDGKKLKPAIVHLIHKDTAQVILKEGRKRQIRRMFEAVNLKVTSLKRIRIGNIQLETLAEGQWRYLKKNESFI